MSLVHKENCRCFGCDKSFPMWDSGEHLRYDRYDLVLVPLDGVRYLEKNTVFVCQNRRGGTIAACERKAWSRLRSMKVCFGCGGGKHHDDPVMYKRCVRSKGVLCDSCIEALDKGDKAVVELKRRKEEVVDEVIAHFMGCLKGEITYGWSVKMMTNPFDRSYRYDSDEYIKARTLFQSLHMFISETANANFQSGLEYGSQLLQRLNDGSMSSRTFDQRIADKRKEPLVKRIDTALKGIRAAAVREL